jgi:hypothetical protein
MKHLLVFLMLLGCILIFSNCSEDELTKSDYPTSDEDIILRAGPDKRPFEGICTFVTFEGGNTWYDDTDDWRTTGTTVWTETGPGFEGTCLLYVAPKNPHDEYRGIWELTWTGTITFHDDGVLIVAEATGIGVEGKVEGLSANWTYTMNYIGNDFPNPENETFVYMIEGNIDKPTGNE